MKPTFPTKTCIICNKKFEINIKNHYRTGRITRRPRPSLTCSMDCSKKYGFFMKRKSGKLEMERRKEKLK